MKTHERCLCVFAMLLIVIAVIGLSLPDGPAALPAPRVGDVWRSDQPDPFWGGGPVWYEVITVRDEWVVFRVYLDRAPTARTAEDDSERQYHTHSPRPDTIRPRCVFVTHLPSL